MSVQIGQPAPDFKAQAVVGTDFKEVRLADYRGKYVVLFFYPLDFTFVCPTEIVAFHEKIGEFEKRGVQVIGVSVDSQFTHLAWKNTPRSKGGLGEIACDKLPVAIRYWRAPISYTTLWFRIVAMDGSWSGAEADIHGSCIDRTCVDRARVAGAGGR